MIFLETKQYQAIHISFYFIDKIETDAYVYRFLLARILTSYTKSYISKQKLTKKLNALYGMFITNHVFVIKDYHIMRFNFVFPNPVILKDDSMMDDILSIIKEMFFDRDLFKVNVYEEAKRYLKNQIKSKKDHKFEYAKERLLSHIFHDHPYAKPVTGYLNELADVSLTSLYDYYQNYFLHNRIKIYISGHITQNLADKLNSLSSYEQDLWIEPLRYNQMQHQITNYEESIKMNQAYIFFAYDLAIHRAHPLYAAAQICSTLLGGSPDSVLFQILRETHYLAYDVDSRFEYDKSLLILYAGINLDQKQFAFDLMTESINNFIFDGPTMKQLKSAKDYLKNEIYASLDFQDSLIPKAFFKDLFELDKDKEDLIHLIDHVSLDDIGVVLSMLKLKTTYILSGDDYDDDR